MFSSRNGSGGTRLRPGRRGESFPVVKPDGLWKSLDACSDGRIDPGLRPRALTGIGPEGQSLRNWRRTKVELIEVCLHLTKSRMLSYSCASVRVVSADALRCLLCSSVTPRTAGGVRARSLTASGMAPRREYRLFRLDANAEPFVTTSTTISFQRPSARPSHSNSADIVRGSPLVSRVAARLSHRQSEPRTGGFA